MEINYYCENGAYHNYSCRISCWNNHPIAKEYPDGYFNKEARKKINEQVHQRAIKNARKAGFTKKQAEYLEKNTGAKFQQLISV